MVERANIDGRSGSVRVVAGTRRQLEDRLVAVSRRLHERGWVANHDGNVTARLADGRLLATPTAYSKGDINRGCLIVLDEEGAMVSGKHRPFSELNLHLFVYRARPDVQAVLHSHAPHATALAVAGIPVEPRMLAEPVVSLGQRIPLIPYAAPKSPESTLNLQPVVQEVDAVTLENHGVLTWGPDLETAFLRMELVEHLARIQLLAQAAGGVRTVPEHDVPALLQARAKAGLGPEGRAAITPAPEAAPAAPAAPVASSANVREVVEQEIARVLRTR